MDVLNIILGLSCVFLSLAYIIYRLVFKSNDTDSYKSMLLPGQIQIYTGVLILLIVGLILIYRELEYYL